MRITNVFPRFKTLAGAETFFIALVNKMETAGHEMQVITRHVAEQCLPLFARPEGIQSEGLLAWRSGNHLFDAGLDTLCSLVLGWRAARSGTKLVCIHGPAVLAIPVIKAFSKAGTRCIYYCYQPPEFVYTQTKEVMMGYRPLGYLIPMVASIYGALDRWCVSKADHLLCFSTDYQRRCREIYRRDDVTLVAPGVELDLEDLGNAQALRVRLGFGARQPVLVTANKLIPKKNVDLFVRLVDRLRRQIPEVRGVIIGDGPQRRALDQLVRELGVEAWIHFTGFLPRPEDVRLYYRMGDLHVFLEKDVPFGLTPLEAGAQQRATIAFRGGGTLDTVNHERTGILLDPSAQLDTIVERCRTLLDNPERLEAMGQAAQAYAKDFSWDTCVSRFETAMLNR